MKEYQVQLWFNQDESPAVARQVTAPSPGKAAQEALRDSMYEVNLGATPGQSDFVFREDCTYVRVTEIKPVQTHSPVIG